MAVINLPPKRKPGSGQPPSTEINERKKPGYRRIRWREFDPNKKTANLTPNQFVAWQPPAVEDDSPEGMKSPAITPKEDFKDRLTVLRSNKLISPPPSPLQPLPLNGTRDNPFSVLPIKRTECVVETLDYFVTMCSGIQYQQTPVTKTPNPHLSLLLPFALENSLLFESIVAVCRASILLSLGKSAYEDPAFIQHRGSALAALNVKLKSKTCTDDAALLTVVMLMTLEYLTGNHYGVTMHCKGLEKMLQLRGPLPEDSDPDSIKSDWVRFVKTGLVGYKALGSFVTGQPPDIPSSSLGFASETFEALDLDKPLSYPEKPFGEDLCLILSRLPSGFSELCLMSHLSNQLINTLASIGAAKTQFEISSDKDSPKYSLASGFMSAETPNHDSQQMTIQNLLSALQRLSLMSPNILETYLSFGLISFMFQFRSLAPLNLFYDPILRQFVAILPHHSKPAGIEEQYALIWTSLSVAGSLGLRGAQLPEGHTVMDHMLDLYPESRKWSRLEKIIRSFFWTDDILVHWKGVWETAMTRRTLLLKRNNSAADVVRLEPPRPSPEWIKNHIMGAPREMREMGEALGICPFRPRSTTSPGD
ncbi:hypothetical protein LTR84_012151 [Exophiala bonariae]|uniref:Transcription factor domain-containing protein n=1 Tax=Exophiala bonariae TaxID=1690606 RepID=A0AAV9NFC6_9EURO|nr:hypothetical protein LTR84_012151 [Exophiala bonariae]